MFGVGIIGAIRSAYEYITSRYHPGDEIILIGCGQSAFTARCIAAMINNVGILTLKGMEYFKYIFKDQQNFLNDSYHDRFPRVPFRNKPRGLDAASRYKQRLEQASFQTTPCVSSSLIHGSATFLGPVTQMVLT